jgi:hypothetical protein
MIPTLSWLQSIAMGSRNGSATRGAALDVAELIEVPGGLERYRPRLRYCLVDEGRIATAELESLRNLTAALFRLEKSRGPEEIERVLVALIDWLHEPEMAKLRRAFVIWLREVLLPGRVPGAEIPQMADLEEVKKAMLAERVKEWTREWQQQGFEKGLKEGLEQGLEKGLEQGLEQGLEKGLEKARAALVRQLEKRFGALPQEARQRIESLDLEAIVDLSASASTAPSLAALGLSSTASGGS